MINFSTSSAFQWSQVLKEEYKKVGQMASDNCRRKPLRDKNEKSKPQNNIELEKAIKYNEKEWA